MTTTQLLTIKQEGDWLLLHSPRYSAELLRQLKDEAVVPRADRKWEDSVWKVRAAHLEAVRTIVAAVAKKEEWEVLDSTAQSPEAIAAQVQAAAQSDLDRHVAAVLAVLPTLPPRALRLVDWREESLQFELRQFLDDPALFRALAQASLEAYRPTLLLPWQHKRAFTHTFVVAADERILHALCRYAGVTPLSDTRGSRSGVEYFVVRELACTTTFEDGVAHFSGEDGSFWIGMPHQRVFDDISRSTEAWQVALDGGVLYRLFERERFVLQLLAVRESQYVNPGFGNVAVAGRHPSEVAMFVTYTHCEAWFRAWGNALVLSDTLTPAPLTRTRWHSSDWSHPADVLIAHFSLSRAGGPAMARLLGWDATAAERYRLRIKELKEQAAQRVIADMKARSAELARPLLEALTIADLLAIGVKHGVELRKSWGKARLVEKLTADPQVCEDVIGLTKHLAGK